ncbi:MAG TPA: hypothetical protein VGE52_02685, partial [Pirellulales bacterium]
IKQVQEQIAALDLPPGFEPKVALNVWWLDGRGAVYQRAADKGVLWLIAIPKWIAEKAPEVANGIGRRTDNGREETAEFEAEEIVDPEETIHTAKIDGKDVPFKLHEGKGRDTGRDLRTLTGSFPSGETVVHILLQAEADSLDDAEIDALLKSIKPAGK